MAAEEKTSVENKSEVRVRRVTIPRPTINSDTLFTVFGLSIPAFFAWVGYWLMFSLAPVSGVLFDLYNGEFAETFREQLPERIETIAGLGSQRGALLIIAGMMLVIFSLLFARVAYGVTGGIQKKLGNLRVPSIFYGVVVFVVLMACFNLVLYVMQINVEGLQNLLASLAPYIGYGF